MCMRGRVKEAVEARPQGWHLSRCRAGRSWSKPQELILNHSGEISASTHTHMQTKAPQTAAPSRTLPCPGSSLLTPT